MDRSYWAAVAVFALFLAYMGWIFTTGTSTRHEARMTCIEVGKQWKDGDCIND